MESLRPLTRTARVAVVALGVFFLAAAVILVSVGGALLWPGTPLDAIWRIRPDRQALLVPYAHLGGPAFLLLAIPAVLASAGVFRRKRWGWWLAVGALAANGAGDAVQIVVGRPAEGVFGMNVAGTIIFGLTRPSMRAAFSPARTR